MKNVAIAVPIDPAGHRYSMNATRFAIHVGKGIPKLALSHIMARGILTGQVNAANARKASVCCFARLMASVVCVS